MPDYFLIALAAFLFAGIIKGTVGIGLPTAAIGVLGQLVEPRLAISLSILPIIAANIWQIVTSGAILETLRKFWLYALTLVVFLLATTRYVNLLPTETLAILVGVMIVAFSGVNLLGAMPPLPRKFDFAAQGIAGAVSGIMGGFTGLWGPPMLIYFLARQTEKKEFVSAMGVLLFIGGLPMAFGYWQAGLLNSTTAPLSALLVIPTLLGFGAGAELRRRLDADRFRTILLVIFLVMGLNLIRKGLFG